MEDPMARLAEARKQIVIASEAITDDDQLEALLGAKRLIDDVRDDGTEPSSQPHREQL